MHASELTVTCDVECHSNPGRDARKQDFARRVQRAEALNQQSPLTSWAAKSKSEYDRGNLTDEKNGKSNSNKPRPIKYEHGDDSNGEESEPTRGPNN